MRARCRKTAIVDFVNDTLKRQLKASLRGATDAEDIDRAVSPLGSYPCPAVLTQSPSLFTTQVEAAYNAEKERADRRFGKQKEKEAGAAGRNGKHAEVEEEEEHEQNGDGGDDDQDMLGFEDEEPLSPPPRRLAAIPADAKGKSRGKRPASPIERQPAKRSAPAKKGGKLVSLITVATH